MTTAIQLTAAATLINGQGLSASPDLVAQLSSLQNSSAMAKMTTVYSTISGEAANIRSDLSPLFSSLGSSANFGHFLLDLYPANVTPICTGNVFYYLSSPLTTRTASVTKTLKVQSDLPFSYGVQGFANVYSTAFSQAAQVFDTVSSVNMLTGKIYAETGLGYSGPLDVATGGLGDIGLSLANAISTWGTMYDINNINNIGDPYVFGQNLLNQGFGQYGNLAVKLSNAGLNLSDLTKIPQSTTTSNQETGYLEINTYLGTASLPVTNSISSSTTVTGNSPDVVLAIYSDITNANLTAITDAANITVPATSAITSLNDYLDLTKVVDPIIVSQLAELDVTTLSKLGQYLQKFLGQGAFISWTDMAEFIRSLEFPTIVSPTTTTQASEVLPTSVSSVLTAGNNGSGPLGNPVISDFLGACAGMPYTEEFKRVNANVALISNSIGLPGLIDNLQAAVDQYIIDYYIWLNSYEVTDPGPPEVGNYTEPYPETTDVVSAIASIDSALTSITGTPSVHGSQAAYYQILNQLTIEVNNLATTDIVFNSGYVQTLRSLAESIGATASDKIQYETYQFFANITSNNSHGDTIRMAVAEYINMNKLSSRGIMTNNDPNPTLTIYQANTQNIPLTEYISRNK